MVLKDFINIHLGQRALVFGKGQSVNQILGSYIPKDIITFGVNDIYRAIPVNYVIFADDLDPVPEERRNYILNNNAKNIFTYQKQYLRHDDKIVFLDLAVSDSGKLKYLDSDEMTDCSSTSPYIAVLLAYKMGCREIGMIGVDFTKNHFFAEDGEYELVTKGYFKKIDKDYTNLYKKLKENNCNLYNLSETSLLTGVPKDDLKYFIRAKKTIIQKISG
jgi:hypothetical protein